VSLLALAAAGLLLNAAASAVALWRGSVDPGGAVVGAVAGTVIFALGGPLFWVILMAFFLSSTAFGRLRGKEKEWLAAIHQKGGKRDMFQVLANGGMAVLTVVMFRLTGEPSWAAGFAVSFAASNADTWASETGVLSRSDPVSPLTFRRVPRGVSGGMSLLGTLMSVAGALFIALVFSLENLFLGILDGGFARCVAFITAGGFLGSLIDSLLGASVQAEYAMEPGSAAAGQADTGLAGPPPLMTERSRAHDGTPRRLVRGLAFVNNDVVNFASCAAVTLAAVLLFAHLS
jgi:uncharacterized protein (TIGR00297 family)